MTQKCIILMRYFRVIFFALFGILFFSWCFTFACM